MRLNKKYYDEKMFLDAGIDHVEAYFLDGSVPPPNVLRQFIAACETTPGAVAVHCKVLLFFLLDSVYVGCGIERKYDVRYRSTEENVFYKTAKAGATWLPRPVQFVRKGNLEMLWSRFDARKAESL